MASTSTTASNHPDVPMADLVLHGGHVLTLDRSRPIATALAVRGGRILAVGNDAEIRRHIGPRTRTLDLRGRPAIPGFIETHAHFLSLGRARRSLELRGLRSWEEIVEIVARTARSLEPGTWIIGRGWHPSDWEVLPESRVGGYPTHESLSAATRHHPVLLVHRSGHLVFANARAMELAEIDRRTPNPKGGEILRDAEGEPTGVFRESAAELLWNAYEQSQRHRTPEEIEAERRRDIERASKECLAYGITSFHDAGSSIETVRFFREAAREGRLGVRLWTMVRDEIATIEREIESVLGEEDFVTVRALKAFCDGALGPHGAWLLEPYADRPDLCGMRLDSPERLRRTAEIAAAYGIQCCIHAIGDRANREVLDLYETFSTDGGSERRWRIEHAQHIHPDDAPRFAELGVIAVMQAIHCVSDAPYVLSRLGTERARAGAYAWRRLLDAGAVVVNGTDAPVEDVNPIGSFHAAISRRLPNGTLFFPEQRMTRSEALVSYTRDAAFAAFQDDRVGTLTPGKLADIVVLSEDLLTVPEDRVRDVRVHYTIVGGEIVFVHAGLEDPTSSER